MRRHITRTLLTVAAAGATITTLGFTLAGSAGAADRQGPAFTPSAPPVATGTTCTISVPGTLGIPSDNCGMAGYVASGRDFRYAQALITVPTAPNRMGDPRSDAQIYVALDNSASDNYNYVRAGISPCFVQDDVLQTPPACGTSTSGWVAYAEAVQAGTIVGTPVTVPISASAIGDGVFASVYREPSGKVVDVRLVVPTAAGPHTYTYAFAYPGATFTQAQARADWTQAHEVSGNPSTAPVLSTTGAKFRYTQFFQGAFTTQAGDRGTFSGPWMLAAPEATTNANLPPLGTLVAQPSYLWNDGLGNGWGDAFGVWIGPF